MYSIDSVWFRATESPMKGNVFPLINSRNFFAPILVIFIRSSIPLAFLHLSDDRAGARSYLSTMVQLIRKSTFHGKDRILWLDQDIAKFKSYVEWISTQFLFYFLMTWKQAT